MIDWIIQYWLQALFGIILAAIVAIVKTQWSKIKAIGKGTQSLLRAELIRSGEKYIERGWIEVYAKDAYDKCYQSYHHLGQNGTMDDMHEKVMDLPTNPIIRKDDNNEKKSLQNSGQRRQPSEQLKQSHRRLLQQSVYLPL